MKRLRWLLLLLAALLLAIGSRALWPAAPRGYPYAVYYLELLTTQTGSMAHPPLTTEDWVDPTGQVSLQTQHDVTGVSDQALYYRGDQVYTILPDGQFSAEWLPPVAVQYEQQWRRQVSDAFQSIGVSALAHASGSVAQVELAGYPALRFSVNDPTMSVQRETMWLDAHTLAPLREQIVAWTGDVFTERYVQWKRIAPNTLPADFFDPPHAQPSLWSRFTGWLQDHSHR